MAKPRAASRSGGGESFRVEASEFTTLMRDAKAFDRDLGLRMRREIRNAAKPIVADVKRKVLEDPPGGGRVTVGTREAIARGVALKISTATKGGGVTVAASGRHLPTDRKAMLRAYNSDSFRHPVYGNRKRWVRQQGNPFFRSVIAEHGVQLRIAVQKALFEAAEALGRKR